tara:strand:+ start:456 stop:626 length:171 start_codon:yes stop_codon:yes gene_type:complete
LLTQWDKDVSDHKVVGIPMKRFYSVFDGCNDIHMSSKGFGHGALDYIHMLRVIIDK